METNERLYESIAVELERTYRHFHFSTDGRPAGGMAEDRNYLPIYAESYALTRDQQLPAYSLGLTCLVRKRSDDR